VLLDKKDFLDNTHMIDIDTISLDSLPASESDNLEYKSSLIDENKLKREIQNAASAFWNSGGGVLLAGVDNKGTIDGGIFRSVGRQTLEDWLAQVISSVNPQGKYTFRVFESSSHTKINAGKCVLAVDFAASTAIPHQSADNCYYIRAGAHTVPAPHFVVEALYAKRHFRSPKLIHLPSINHFSTVTDFLHVEVIAATDGLALDVEIDFDPRPNERGLAFPLVVPIIDREHPFAFRFEIAHQPVFVSTLKITYRDFANASYSYEKRIDASQCLSPWHRDAGALGSVSDEIRELKRAIERMNHGPWFT
jgi:hypothetical protein